MSDWRKPSEADPRRVKTAIAAAVVVACVALLLWWIHLARSEDETVSSNGFRDSGGPSGSPFSPERRSQTGLAFVRLGDVAGSPSSVKPEASASSAAVVSASAPSAPGLAAQVPGASPASAVPGAAGAPPDPKEMAAHGVPTDAAGLKKLGSDSALLTGAISKLLDHPRILKALLDNKLVVNALMDREDSKRNCSDAGALQSALSTPGATAYEKQMSPLISAALARPDAIVAMAGSEMGSRLMACPSVQGLARNTSGLMAIAAANPTAVSMVTDPRVVQAMTLTTAGTSLLGNVQSSVGTPSLPSGSPP